MKYLYLALAIACLFASTFADDCTGTTGAEGEWSEELQLTPDCPQLSFTVNGTDAATNDETVVAAVHLPDDEDGVALIITFATTNTNTTTANDNNAKICVSGADISDSMVFYVSSNETIPAGNSTTFQFYYEFADECEDVSSPSSGFCCWGWVILGLVVAVLVVVIIAAVAGFMIWKKRQSQDKYIYDDA